MNAVLPLQPQTIGSWLHEPFLARAAEPGAVFGRQALGAFLTLRLADRFRPDEEQPHPLALAYQIRATRDYLLELHPQTPEVAHLLEVVRLTDAVQHGGVRSSLWPPLLAYAFWLEEELRLREALDVLDTALGLTDGRAPTEEVAALLQRGRVLRLLGRLDEARASYNAARQRAVSTGDTHSTLLARIGDAIVMRQVGNLPGSEDALRAILKEARGLQDTDAQARAYHDLGLVLTYRSQTAEALPNYYRAFELYERPAHKLRALSDLGETLKRDGKYLPARDAFIVVLRNHPTEEMRACTMIALLELSAQVGDRLGFALWKREIEAMGEELPAERRADFKLQLGLGYLTFGQVQKAERSLRKAIALAEQYHLNEYAFRAEAALSALKQKPAPDIAEAPVLSGAGDSENSKELAEIAEKLQALRAS